ncbi:hypothetical protein ERJ75_000069400 [Trypanosoma vivax]|nr:hypothetical protein ERJ75_000069400 [Trypanosoma vivax]
MPSPRASGAPQFDVPCEDGSRASLEAKKRAAAPETMNSAADMVFDSAAEERRQHCNQARPVARPEAKREAASNSGSSSAQLRQASASAGKRSASTQTAEGVRKRRWHHKSDGPRPAPPIFGVASGPRRQANANGVHVGAENVHNETPRRIRNSTRAGNVAGERAAFYCEFEAGEKQHRAAHKGAAVADGGWGGAGSDASLRPSGGSGGKSRKADAANDAVGTAPRLQRDGLLEGPRCCATRVGHGGSL